MFSLVLKPGEGQNQHGNCLLPFLSGFRANSSKGQLLSSLSISLLFLPPPFSCAVSVAPWMHDTVPLSPLFQTLLRSSWWWFLAFLKSSFSFPSVTLEAYYIYEVIISCCCCGSLSLSSHLNQNQLSTALTSLKHCVLLNTYCLSIGAQKNTF